MIRFEYKKKLYAFNGDTLPEDIFEADAAFLGDQGWELVTVVPVLGKRDLIGFWKRRAGNHTENLEVAIIKANDILDAALQKDAGRGELLDAVTDAAAVLDAAMPAPPRTTTPVAVSDLQSRLPAIGMEDRSEPLDDDNVPETSVEADFAESVGTMAQEEVEKKGRALTAEEFREVCKKAGGG